MATPGQNRSRRAGRHFLQIPGPTPVPDRILKAMAMPVIDHRGPQFQELGERVLTGIKTIFKTQQPVFIFPASGSGAWEAALANTLSPGDHVLFYETGHFATLWKQMAEKLNLKAEFIETDWRRGVEPDRIEERLRQDQHKSIKAVCVVHNETSSGALSSMADVRAAIDAAGHPALFMVDSVSGLGSADLCHDDWGIDVTVSGSQKGLMLPPGLGFTAVSQKALAASQTAELPNAYFRWSEMLGPNQNGFFPYTPATNLLYGLAEAIDMMHEEGLDNIFARHKRHGEASRRAVQHWGLSLFLSDAKYYSPVLTAVEVPEGHNADDVRRVILEHFDISLGTGLSKVAGKVFRIGHLGDINDATLIGALAGVEMGLARAGVPHQSGGVHAAMSYLAETSVAH